jgi:hypothetical protein
VKKIAQWPQKSPKGHKNRPMAYKNRPKIKLSRYFASFRKKTFSSVLKIRTPCE